MKTRHLLRAPLLVATLVTAAVMATGHSATWKTDPGWNTGKAEWALYDAERMIYGKPRAYEATLFTNRQMMDPRTTVKTDSRDGKAIEVFKHNLSEMIPTERYTYRFLTTCFLHTNDLSPYKLVMSSQEDCGSTYKQILAGESEISFDQFCYFPGDGATSSQTRRIGSYAWHDGLSLRLRDYPFDTKPELRIKMVEDLTDTHASSEAVAEAIVVSMGEEELSLPYGTVQAHHIKVTHAPMGGARESHYWFAADPSLRHVMVQYSGPYGVRYRLKRLEWWAYWRDPQP